jgi:hypothetical protein
MEPGVVLAGFLSAIDLDELSGHDRVTVLRAHQRMASHYEARMVDAMAAVTDSLDEPDQEPTWAAEAAAAEIAAALRLTRRATDGRLSFALDLDRRLPVVLERLRSGVIDVARAKVLVDGTAHLDDDAARLVVGAVVDSAPRLTTGQLRARVQKLCLETDPGDAKRRSEEAIGERRVVTHADPAGTAHLFAFDLPPDRVAAATDRIDRLARALRRAGESRTMDQLRADVLLDLLEGNPFTAPAAGGVEITVDLATLAGLVDHAGDLHGFGPVVADIARRVAHRHLDSPWRFTVTDPDTARPVATGITRRRPGAAQRRRIRARHRTCVFPGCRMPATSCDLDHTERHADGGPTTDCNLAPLCEHHHTTRHRYEWTYRRLDDGDHLWTSRLGHTYTTTGRPPP